MLYLRHIMSMPVKAKSHNIMGFCYGEIQHPKTSIAVTSGGKTMTYFLQRECNLETTVAANAIMKFETPIAQSKTSLLTDDFEYQEDGTINIMQPGTYTVFWYTVGMVSHSTVGKSFQIKKLDYGQPSPTWNIIAGSSNHIKTAQTPGFAIVVVSESEIYEHEKATIALFNTADAPVELTMLAPRSGILVFGFALNSIEDELTGISEQITNIFNELQRIEEFVHLSEVTEIWSLSAELMGLGVSVISSGYTHNFWGIGTLNHQQTLTGGAVYYLVNSSQYEPLTFYQGDSTIGTLWIETLSPSNIFSFPIRFDGTGIFFTPDTTYQNLPPGTSFKFTQALILVDSSTS